MRQARNVSTAYTTPFAFTGKLESVVVDVSGELITDDEAERRPHSSASSAAVEADRGVNQGPHGREEP